jgi:ribosomal protein S6
MIVISPDVPEEELQGLLDRTTGYITDPGGTVVAINRDSPWGRRRLSYAMRHDGRDIRDGFYTLYQFQIEPHKVEDIERELKLTDRIMRYLLTQYTPRAAAPLATEEELAAAEYAASQESNIDEVAEVENEAGESAAEDIAVSEAPAPVESEPVTESEPEVETEPEAETEPEPDTETQPEAETEPTVAIAESGEDEKKEEGE